MEIVKTPEDLQKKFTGKLAGERGKSFVEISGNSPSMPADPAIIPKKDLRHGAYYLGKCRNATVARWHAEKERFYHWRTKFGQDFIEEIKHREDDDHFDVFDAFVEIRNPEREIPF